MPNLARVVGAALGAIAMTGAVSACTAGGSPSATGGGTSGAVTLTFLTFETPNLSAATWDAAIARTSAKVPGVTIKKLVAPTADRLAYAKQLSASGQLPDIMVAVAPADFVKAGQLAPFEPSELGKFTSPQANSIGGKTYQLPWASQGIPLVYYNKDAFAKAGVNAPPTTYAEFLQVCAKLKAAGITPIEIGGGGSDTWANAYTLTAAVGTDVYKNRPTFLADLLAGKAKFTDPDFVKAATKVAELAKNGYLDKGGLSRSYANTEQAFRDGKAAMYPMGTWFPASADAKPPAFGLDVFPWPTDDGSVVVSAYTGGGLTVSSKAANVELAKKWAVEFATQSENLDAQVKADGLFMAVKDYKAPTSMGAMYQKSLAIYEKAVADGGLVDAFSSETGSTALPSGMTPDLYAGIADLINGKKSPQEFAEFLDGSLAKNLK